MLPAKHVRNVCDDVICLRGTTTKFKFPPYIFMLGSKFKDCQYFQLYGTIHLKSGTDKA